MSSDIEICNLALSLLGQNPITNLLNPQTSQEQLCALQYPLMRDAVLEEVEWSFAVKRYSSNTPLVAAPVWGYQYKHAISTDILRVTYCSDNTDELMYNAQFQWVVEGNSILTDSPQIYYRTINMVPDSSKFSSLFVQALASRLAMEMCVAVTENLRLYQTLAQGYAAKIAAAGTMDSMQGKAQRLRVGRLYAARGGI